MTVLQTPTASLMVSKIWSLDKTLSGVLVKREYVRIAGELVAGTLLSQLVYWHRPDSHGQSKLRVIHDGRHWLAKTRETLAADCFMTLRQYKRAMSVLQGLGLVEVRTYKFSGRPVSHFSLNLEVLESELRKLQKVLPDGTEGTYNAVQNVQSDGYEKSQSNIKTSKETSVESVKEAQVTPAPKTNKEQPGTHKHPSMGIQELTGVWLKYEAEKKFTGKELGMLKGVRKHLGTAAPVVVDRTLKNWDAFALKVRWAAGYAHGAPTPAVWMVAKHYDIAVNMLTNPKSSFAPGPELSYEDNADSWIPVNPTGDEIVAAILANEAIK